MNEGKLLIKSWESNLSPDFYKSCAMLITKFKDSSAF